MKFLIGVFFLLIITEVFGQKRQYLTHFTTSEPKIDGLISEVEWEVSEWEGDFVETEPFDSVTPTFKTQFKAIYSNKSIFFAIRCFDNEPEKIYAPLVNRDEEKGDNISVRLDSYHDLRTAFVFTVSAKGVLQDQKITNDVNWDVNWNAIWNAKTNIDSLGWTAEIEIPFSQLRYGNDSCLIWGLQIKRKNFRFGEVSQWQYRSVSAPGMVYFFGELHGLKNISNKHQLSIMPYIVGSFENFEPNNANPFNNNGHDSNIKPGVDAKIGITNDFTLDLTVNPDFGQVEADPSEVNLTAYETFYEEKRPFFIEGKSMLEMKASPGSGGISSDNLFYSRRLGRKPHYTPDEDLYTYTKNENNTSIISALKLTGKTQNGLSVGILESVTAEETASFVQNDSIYELAAEPLTNYFIGSLTKDFNKGNSIVQGMVTATNRNIEDENLTYLPNAAYTGGIDYTHYFGNKTYFLNAKFLGSHVTGDSSAITELQRSPLRYFQRPDADYLTLDSSRTSLSGTSGSLCFGKGGKGFSQFSTWITWRSPSLELNDIGYQREADHIQQVLWYNIRRLEPWYFFRYIQLHLNEWYGCDFSGRMMYFGVNVYTDFKFKNQWALEIGHTIKPDGIDNTGLRGGPGLKYDGGYDYFMKIRSNDRKKLTVNTEIFFSQGFNNSYDVNFFRMEILCQINDKIFLQLAPYYKIYKTSDIYIDTKNFNNENKYLLSALDQKTFAAQIKINVNITPRISVQYYGQPFISSNYYESFKIVNNPLADDIEDRYNTISSTKKDDDYFFDENNDGTTDYTNSNPDFTSIEFVSNLVFKYEFRPGSFFYFVWSQGRADYPEGVMQSTTRGLNDMFEIYPHDVFMMKFSYLIGK